MRLPKDFNEIFTLANQGDNTAQRQIGSMYYYGRGGVEKSHEEAAKWFKTAGWQRMLGICYLYGHGVEQNYEEAAKCFHAADDKDMLGECYLHGLGVERNVDKTIELWETACEEQCRNYDVMFKLAHLYGDGIEMKPDYKKALSWWSQLAQNDSGEFAWEGAWPEALYQMALYYYEGKGVKRNLKEALKLFRYTIDLFFVNNRGSIYYREYDRDNCNVKWHFHKIEGDITISDEPDFIIHARKILVKHGCKSAINKIRNFAQNGDKKAAEILNEFEIEFIAPIKSKPAEDKSENEVVFVGETKGETIVQLALGETVTHRIYGEGKVCKADGDIVCVEFNTVGKKNFLNPEAFFKGFLTLEKPV